MRLLMMMLLGLSTAAASDWPLPENATHVFLKYEVGRALEQIGIRTWLDEDHIVHDIDHCMAHGIDRCDAFVVFLTRKYVKKTNSVGIYRMCTAGV